MLYLLALGRDMNATGTSVGPQAQRILDRAFEEYAADQENVTLVVAPGYSPDIPDQPCSYASTMAAYLKKKGCQAVVELEAETFDTDGEIRVFREFCQHHCRSDDVAGVCGFTWHLPRARAIAYVTSIKWARRLQWVPVEFPMPEFDRKNEWKKWVKVFLPRQLQQPAVRFYKRYISRRTSY